MERKLIILLALIVCLAAGGAAAEKAIRVSSDRPVRGYQNNVLTVTCGEPGLLTLTVVDRYNVWTTICEDLPVSAGANQVTWDGLGDNQERIEDGKYAFSALERLEDGSVVTADTQFTLAKCRQALVFALPSGDTMYRDGSWYAEVKLIRPGNLVTEYYHAEDMSAPFHIRKKAVSGYRVQKWSWEGKIGGAALPAGAYVIRFYAEENPSYACDVRVTLVDGERPKAEIAPTGPVLPADDASDAEIWERMMQPSVVVDIRNKNHQKVFAEPTAGSAVLGTLHGQSQALEVLEVREDGWVRIAAWVHENGERVEGYVPLSKLKVVQPQNRYGLVFDKRNQTLTVFEEGRRLGTIQISTGLIEPKKLFQETAAGAFLTQEHMSDYSTNGKVFQYVIRYDGGNLLHSIAYNPAGKLKNYAKQSKTLGQKASNGCLRIQHSPGENGLNAYWVWTHIPAGTRVLVLDDPEQRAQQRAGLGRKAETPAAAAPQPKGETGTELLLTVGGDTVLGTRESWWELPESFPSVLNREGASWPFAGLRTLFAEDDVTLVNLECTLKEDGEGEDRHKEYRFRGLPAYTEVLQAAGIDTVNIANNHVEDYGAAGMEATRAALTAGGVPYSGYGSVWVFEKDGHRIGFAGCRETVYRGDRNVIRRDINTLKALGCDVIVYSCHWGQEYSKTHSGLQRTMAEAAAECGADIVVGTHPHVVQGIEQIGHTLVLYSLGNLMFGGTHELKTLDGLVCSLRLRFDAAGKLEGAGLTLHPVLVSGRPLGETNDFRPGLAEGEDFDRILADVRKDSQIPVEAEMYFDLR